MRGGFQVHLKISHWTQVYTANEMQHVNQCVNDGLLVSETEFRRKRGAARQM